MSPAALWDVPWTEEYQVAYLEMNHRADGNKKGIFTPDRRPKAAAHALRARWTRVGNRLMPRR
ncbi:hypothetical protein [Amycolatopsis sp.]|uniref:hypothetical protein n=1 Tax=Amycolatopsis sp. TaxID=37632 RepID=UPI002D7F5CDB|nr:hypothetical protein [Amycolatopsis sp.]HET6711344.1 hypothetical protein [Amycolatopsis sp.]